MTSSHASTPSDLSGAHSPVALARSLIGDVRSVGLVGQKTSALTAFAEQVVTQVQALNDAVVIEEYSGAEFLPLISRLNREVAPHLLTPAAALATSGPMHICLIHQADQLSTEQQSILFRLIELFPALPFRMVWLSRQPLHAGTSHAAMTSVIVDLDAQAASRQGRSRGQQMGGDFLIESADEGQKFSAAVLFDHDGIVQGLDLCHHLFGEVGQCGRLLAHQTQAADITDQ